MNNTGSKWKTFWAATAAAAAFSVVSPEAHAQAQSVSMPAISVESQDLGGALRTLARQTGSQIIFDPAIVQGLRAPSVEGVYSPEQAIRRMIAGSGLTYRATGADTYVILAQASAPPQSQRGAEPSAPAGAENEIVVTAQRRSEDIQRVPISVAAVGGETLEALSIGTTTGLQMATPGIVNTSTAGDGISAVYIRGVGTGYSGPGLEGSVAFYLDDVYMQTQTSSAQSTIDVAQVEVLKGPQGTLYGRNATGGAVLITTNEPELGEYSGYVRGGLGNYNWRRGEGVLNVPIGSDFALRFAGFSEVRDGYAENSVYPRQEDSGVGAGETWGARIRALWEPTPDFSLLGTVSYDRRDGNGAIHSLRYNPDGSSTGLGFYETTQSLNREGGGGDDTDARFVSLRAEYEFGDWTLTNTLANRITRAFGCTDNDGLPVENLYFCTVSQRSPNPGTADGKRDDTLTNEIRLVSDTGGRFDLTAGLFYERNRARFVGRVGGSFFTGTPTFDNRDTLDAYSAYVELYTQLTDRVRLTTGVRYTHEEKEHSVWLDEDASGTPGGVDMGSTSEDFSDVSPRIVISYDAGSTNYYASYNRGFKSGGFNSPSFGLEDALDPETIDAYEIGAKYRSPGGALRLDGALFYYDWSDVQISFITDGGVGLAQQNAAAAENYGAEFNLDYAPNQDWQFNLGVAYTHARFSEYTNALVYNFDGGVLAEDIADLSGEPVPQAPDWTLTGRVTRSFPLPDGWMGDVTLSGRFTTEYDFTAGGGGELEASRQDELALFNLTGSFTSPDDAITFGWFVNNVTDEEYISLISTGTTGVYMTPAEPRIIGATLQYSF